MCLIVEREPLDSHKVGVGEGAKVVRNPYCVFVKSLTIAAVYGSQLTSGTKDATGTSAGVDSVAADILVRGNVCPGSDVKLVKIRNGNSIAVFNEQKEVEANEEAAVTFGGSRCRPHQVNPAAIRLTSAALFTSPPSSSTTI